jgi:hypothetical protein
MTWRLALVAALAIAAGLSACWDGNYHCSLDTQCSLSGTAGKCQPNGSCSFPADDCPSHWKYARYSAGGEQCVPAPPVPSTCANGMLDVGESCDPDVAAGSAGFCPVAADCDDNNPCTSDVVSGSAAQCSARCTHEFITVCGRADQCCQAGCTAASDPDCSATCGNGLVEPGETCDRTIAQGSPGACPTSCPSIDKCNPITLIGDASVCTAKCVTNKITTCSSGDGCCPTGCNTLTDLDCPLL